MSEAMHVEAAKFVRKLRGGSQPILVAASDGCYYVVKFLNNLQGPNLLFNDALGSELFRLAGLLVPEWRFVHISEDFLDQNPGCWMETEYGRRRPKAGFCFGSRFLELKDFSTYEILSENKFSRIINRRDFWIAWVLDVFCGHSDNRQAIFVEASTKFLYAYFIDHGHLFGGPLGTDFPNFLASRYLDRRIYANATTKDADDVQNMIHGLDWAALSNTVRGLPAEWITETAIARFEHFTTQISNSALFENAVHTILDLVGHAERKHDRCRAQCAIEIKRTDMHAAILPHGVAGRVDGWARDIASGQGPRGPETIRPSYPQAANF